MTVNNLLLAKSVSILFLIQAIKGNALESWESNIVKVMTGDILQVRHNDTIKNIQLWGIQAPKEPHPFASISVKNLEQSLTDFPITIVPYPSVITVAQELNSVIYAKVYLGERYINGEQILKGFAWAMPSFNQNRELLLLELKAFSQREGLWEKEDTFQVNYRNNGLSIKSSA